MSKRRKYQAATVETCRALAAKGAAPISHTQRHEMVGSIWTLAKKYRRGESDRESAAADLLRVCLAYHLCRRRQVIALGKDVDEWRKPPETGYKPGTKAGLVAAANAFGAAMRDYRNGAAEKSSVATAQRALLAYADSLPGKRAS